MEVYICVLSRDVATAQFLKKKAKTAQLNCAVGV